MWVVQVTLVGPLDLTLFDCDAYADSLQLCSCAVTTRVESKMTLSLPNGSSVTDPNLAQTREMIFNSLMKTYTRP